MKVVYLTTFRGILGFSLFALDTMCQRAMVAARGCTTLSAGLLEIGRQYHVRVCARETRVSGCT